MAAMVSGTMAAVVPMEVPATSLVKGMMATMRIMNGMERMRLIMKARGLFNTGQARMPCFSVTTRRIPRGMPIKAAMIAETESMYSVSARLFRRRLVITGDISDYLTCNW